VPILTSCANRLVGRRISFSDDGCDHVCFVVEITEVRAAENPIELLRLADVRDLRPGHEARERAAET
jgi:hypothetical protein